MRFKPSLSVALLATTTFAKPGTKPNVVFILTDDQDLHMNSLDYLPFVKNHLLDQGTFYRRHFW
jgi:hypothetical protein